MPEGRPPEDSVHSCPSHSLVVPNLPLDESQGHHISSLFSDKFQNNIVTFPNIPITCMPLTSSQN